MNVPKIKTAKLRGNPVWVVDYKLEGLRKRKYFPNQTEAMGYAKTLAREESKFGQSWVAMETGDRLAVGKVLAEIQQHGVTLDDVWRGYQTYLKSLTEASVESDITLKQAREAFVVYLEKGGRRGKYVQNMKNVLQRFSRERESMFLSQLTVKTFQDWFVDQQASGVALVSLRCYRTRLYTFCKWAQKNGHMPKGTWEEKTLVEPVEIPLGGNTKNIRIVTPEEAKALLRVTALRSPHVLVYLVCAMFCGIRPDECLRLQLRDFDVDDEKEIDLESDKSKTNNPRMVPIPPNAVEWLKLAQDLGHWSDDPTDLIVPGGENVIAYTRPKHWAPLIAKGWQTDILRHSAASYRYLITDSLEQVGRELGNTPEVLRESYIRQVKKEKAVAFYSIVPSPELLNEARAAQVAKKEARKNLATHLLKLQREKAQAKKATQAA